MLYDTTMIIEIRSSEFKIEFDCRYAVDDEKPSFIIEIEISDVKIYSDKKKQFIKPSNRLQKEIVRLLETDYEKELDKHIKDTWGY